VYIKSKPGQYGLKVLVSADTETLYVLKLQVYTGMTCGKREVNEGQQVVMDLLEPYFGSWRGVTDDNFFTSEAMAEELFKICITVTRTLHSNKPDIPQEFLPHSKREEY
jgi:hypothetical protein